MSESPSFTVGDIIRIPNYDTCKGYRVWKVIGVYLGGLKQEGTYELFPLDVSENKTIQVPCIMLETHPLVKRF